MTDISALEGYAGMLSEAAAQAKAASAKQEQYVEGGAWQDVETEGGMVPALAKQARLAGEKIDSALTDVAAQMAGAMVFATTAAGLAAVPANGFFSVPSSSSDEYLVLYKKVGGAAVEQNRYPNSKAVAQAELAVAASLTTSDLTFVSGWASEANNGGVITRRYGRPCGISVPQGSTGTLTYLTVMFPTANVDVTSLVGSTVQAVITGRYTGSFGDAVKLRTDRAFRSLLAGNVISNVGRVVSETYASGQYRRVVQYKVEAVDTQIGVLLSVEAGGAAPANSTLTIDRVSFGIVAASPKLTQSGTANLERAKLFEDMNANAGLSWQWEPAVISNGWGYFPNGASALPAGAVAPAIAGLKVPAASTGADAYCFNLMTLDAEQVKLMAGSTVRITAKFTATPGALDVLDFQFLAGMRAARGNAASAVVAATLVSMTQEGSVITKVVDYVVDPTDVSWAVSLQVHGSAVAPGQDISVQFKSLTWAVQGVPAGNKRAADVAFLARFQEQIKPTEKSLLVSSANLLDKATVTGSADANGAVLVRDNGIIIGFDIPAGKSGAGVYNRVLLPFDAATRAAIVGKTIRMTLEAEVSLTFAADKLLRKDRAVYVEGGIGNAGTLISEAFAGTRYTRVVEYLVADGAALFGPVLSYIAGAVSTNANSLRLKSVRWQVSEVNAGVSVQDFMIDQRLAAVPKETAQAENYTGAVTVVGTQLETKAVTGFSPMIQAFTVNKLGGLLKTVEQAVAIAAPDTEPVVDHPFTLIAAPSGGAIPGARLPHQYSSNRVVKRVSDGAVLTEGVDYAVKPNTCYLYGLKAIANEPCTISYTGHLHRYDLVSVNLASGALVVTKGTGRAIDPEEYKPVLPAGQVRLNEVYVYPSGVDVLQSWRYRDLRDQLAGQAYDDWLAYCRSKLPKTLAKLRRGQRIRLIGYGSSSVDMGGGVLYPLQPNINRDLASFFDRIPADTRAKYP
ncbi:hypothetical protein RBI94_31140, partial [Pseudomonas putida]|uniref:hypothetical protein n=1 Tax=Pseudomonas putida TaxID=303 RepID=UPI0027D1433E